MKDVREKLLATALVSILAGLSILFSGQTSGVQSQPRILLSSPEPVDVAVTNITVTTATFTRWTNIKYNTTITTNQTIARLDANSAVTFLLVLVTLNATNVVSSENVTLGNTTVLLALGARVTFNVSWYETPNTLPVGNYDINCFADPTYSNPNVYDTNMTNNIMDDGNITIFMCREDLWGDGKIDIIDLNRFSFVLGDTGSPGWIREDVMPDGVVDYFDILMVARMWLWTITSSSFQPYPEPWKLTISTPPGQSQNDSVVVYSDYIVYSNYSFNQASKQLSFNIASSIDGFCNVTIPKTSMSGNFTVYLDDVPTSSTVTWNATCYCVYFSSTGLSQKVRIVSEYVEQIPGDVNHDGTVNILDSILVSNAFLSTPGSPNWNLNADINGDNVVNILDSIIQSNHFLEHYP